MITNNSIKEYYTKLHGMYIQCYDMIKAMTQSLSTRDSQISLVEEYIYSEQRDLHKFYADLDILFDTIFQEIRQKIGF